MEEGLREAAGPGYVCVRLGRGKILQGLVGCYEKEVSGQGGRQSRLG